ncbi:uroporphyrinogen-III synthase [Brevibacterium sp. BRM-1]|uniref:uroporphyrinogen-III synthase n=1 Tax=Brevibacterium sp. BRM-1 TaxID=2999062 RepID=UPI00227F8B52|nr:uroporphyrinogen-III synthase [Brevibacterium sp. BRM-1]WAL41577.1 uroporphyrinogen-III synthase [Brevibacterium sp. BRM-1]
MSDETKDTAPADPGTRVEGAPAAGDPAHAQAPLRESPHVYFLGAGPGDPGLMTMRGADLLAAAGVVVHDERIHDDILDAYLPTAARRIDAAELGTSATTRGRRLAALAQEEGVVVRLVPYDGVLFSTTTDEAAAVHRGDVPFEIVPGIGLSAAVSAYTGTPLTTNRVRSVRFVEAGEQSHVDVSKHRNTGHVLMGSPQEMTAGIRALLADGWDPQTPALIAANVSTISQLTIETALGAAPDRIAEEIADEHLTVLLGQGIAARSELSWFESRPLFGWQVLIPRTKEQGADTSEVLAEFGAVGTVVPTIAIQPPRTPQQMDKAIRALVDGDYQWVGFTSVNAVRAVRMRLANLGLDTRSLAGVKVAAVGGKTAEALGEWGIDPDLVPTAEQSARGLAAIWPEFDDEGGFNRVLLPRADIATEVLVTGLTERGWQVDDVTAYRTVRAAPPPAPVRDAIKGGEFDAVLFTSSSTVRNLVGIAGKPHPTTVVACIGPATAQTARDHGLRVDVTAPEANVGALIDALVADARRMRDEDLAAGLAPLRPSQKRRSRSRRS